MPPNRARPPIGDSIPSKPVAAALAEYIQAGSAARDAAGEFERLVRRGGEARAADRRATTAALAAGEPIPPAAHQREHAEQVELAERVRDSRKELADVAWARFEALWGENRAEMLDTLQKDDQRDRKQYARAIDQLEALVGKMEARSDLLLELGGSRGPGDMLAIPASALPMQDAPTGLGLFMVAHVVAALRQLGLPQPQPIAPGEHLPLAAQGRAQAISPPGGPAALRTG
jgi:hypothetical protein